MCVVAGDAKFKPFATEGPTIEALLVPALLALPLCVGLRFNAFLMIRKNSTSDEAGDPEGRAEYQERQESHCLPR